MLDNPAKKVRDVAVCGSLIRTERWAYIDSGKAGGELYDMDKDPQQYTNLYKNPEFAAVLAMMKEKRQVRLAEISNCDIEKRVGKSKKNKAKK